MDPYSLSVLAGAHPVRGIRLSPGAYSPGLIAAPTSGEGLLNSRTKTLTAPLRACVRCRSRVALGVDRPSTKLICSAWSSCPAAPTPISQRVRQPLRRGKAPPDSVENGREVSAGGLIVQTSTHQCHDLPDA